MKEFNPLINKKVVVKIVEKAFLNITNQKHTLANGMHENSKRSFVVPVNANGTYKSILTKEEQDFFEEYFNLEKGDMSVHKKNDNYWDDKNVVLGKFDNYLYLNNAEDYIKYKILLANDQVICPSMEDLHKRPKATYMYVLQSDEEIEKINRETTDLTLKAHLLLGKLQDEKDKLRVIIEELEGKPFATTVSSSKLLDKMISILKSDKNLVMTKHFIKLCEDKLLDHKVFFRRCVDNSLVANKGSMYYTMDNNMPLCENGQEPTFEKAVMFLANPKHQDLYLKLKAKLEM